MKSRRACSSGGCKSDLREQPLLQNQLSQFKSQGGRVSNSQIFKETSAHTINLRPGFIRAASFLQKHLCHLWSLLHQCLDLRLLLRSQLAPLQSQLARTSCCLLVQMLMQPKSLFHECSYSIPSSEFYAVMPKDQR